MTASAPRHLGRGLGVRRRGPATSLIQAGKEAAALPHTVGPPIVKGSTVLLPDPETLYGLTRTYGRAGLTTQDALASALGGLEEARGVCLFPSGLAAMTGAMLAVLKTGDEVLITDAAYKPTRRFCDRVLTRFGIDVRYFDPAASPEALMALASDATRLIVLESPGSLTFEMQDVAAIAELARRRGILTLMDNTWAAGLFFKPLAHGVDISVQSLTKYVGGHSDVFMGSAASADDRLRAALDQAIIDHGWAVSPEDAYQMLRGLRTLPTRMARHQASALAVAHWLGSREEVADVLFPALPRSRDHGLWKRDYSGAAGLFTVVLRPCSPAAVRAFLAALELFGLGFSWGGFESLAINADPQFAARRIKAQLAGPAIRLSIGLEDVEDLIGDLERGFLALRVA